ncbi:hypothetical protein JKF63_00612 [Porcisia hertigi]|uniref:Phosphate transporter n=1 Tax=Porcisia hertigi TaxID=2761500 RepID=A0A836KYH5_9TRYP|nr:hypothetical protein JKF63_00612 [Porcisia hertigi]
MKDIATCKVDVEATLPLVCIGTLLSFLCGVGIGANDLSANFAMVVGSGSLNMKQAIIYCTVFELLGAAFMGGHVSNTIRGGIVDPVLFSQNRDVVVIGMTCASFAAALWLYLSTVLGLPVSITHTVVGSILGFALFVTGGFAYVKSSGLVVVVISWVAAPIAACGVTALLFFLVRRDIFNVKGRSFEVAVSWLPHCLLASLLIDFFFIVIEQPPIMSQTFAQYIPLQAQYIVLLAFIFLFCWAAKAWVFPEVVTAAKSAQSFVWESDALRTEPVDVWDVSPRDEVKISSCLNSRELPSPMAAITSGRQPSQRHHHHHRQLQQVPADATATESMAAPAAPQWPQTTQSDKVTLVPTLSSLPLSPLDSGLADHDRSECNSSDCQTVSRPGTPAPLHQNCSLVLSSISPSGNSFVCTGCKVRLTPVHTRSHPPALPLNPPPFSTSTALGSHNAKCARCLPGRNLASCDPTDNERQQLQSVGVAMYGSTQPAVVSANTEQGPVVVSLSTPSVHSEDEFGEEDWAMDHAMHPIRFGGILIKPFNPRAEYLFTGLQVVAGSISSFVHGAVAGANATAAFVILYDAFTNHELQEPGLSSRWAMLPAMLGIAIGMFGLGASLMKTVGMELVTVTPARGWCIQVGGTLVTMVLTGVGIPVSLSQSQIGAAIGCGVLDAKLSGVSWGVVTKVATGWVVTVIISAATTALSTWLLASLLCP